MGKQADRSKRQTESQVGWLAGRQRDIWTGRQTFRQAKQKDRQKGR